MITVLMASLTIGLLSAVTIGVDASLSRIQAKRWRASRRDDPWWDWRL